MDEGNKDSPFNREEGESVYPLGVAPHRLAKHIVGRLTDIDPGYDGKVEGGARQETCGLG